MPGSFIRSSVPDFLLPGNGRMLCWRQWVWDAAPTTLACKTTSEVFTRAGPDHSLERLTERSVGLVTDRPGDVYELFVSLLY